MNTTIRQNFLSPNNYRLSIDRLPHVSYFAQAANIPGLSINPVPYQSPFKTIYRPGDKVEFNTLDVDVRVDEGMENYMEIYNWIIGMTYPDNFEQYANLIAGEGLYSDATLTIQNNSKVSNIDFEFKDIFPVSIGSIQMSQTNAEVEYATATITFQTNGFTIRKYS